MELERAVAQLIDHEQIRDVVHRYCRAIDRCDFELLRTCYHDDAIDDHGDFVGGVDEFVEYVRVGLARYETTMHFVGNILIECDRDRARVESYTVAYHRVAPSRSRPERDLVVGLRYVDDMLDREGAWRIARRVCCFDWWRMDPVGEVRWRPADRASTGRRDRTDAVYAAWGGLPGAS